MPSAEEALKELKIELGWCLFLRAKLSESAINFNDDDDSKVIKYCRACGALSSRAASHHIAS